MAFEVVLWSEHHEAVRLVGKTIEMLGFESKLTQTVDGKFVVESKNEPYVRWAVKKQGYVREVR